MGGIQDMNIDETDGKVNIFDVFKDILKICKLDTFFKYGFYVALIIWICGICFSTFYDGSAAIRIVVIVVTLCNYIFFVIGKAVLDSKFGK